MFSLQVWLAEQNDDWLLTSLGRRSHLNQHMVNSEEQELFSLINVSCKPQVKMAHSIEKVNVHENHDREARKKSKAKNEPRERR